jgi:hypothetical protein
MMEDEDDALKERVCKLAVMEDGVPKECGGKIERQQVDRPFSSQSMIGGPPEPPLFSYARCKKCRVVYDG